MDASIASDTKRVMPLETARIGIPERFEIQDGPGTLRIQWKWPRLVAVPLAIFTVAWDGFLVSWYSNLLTQGNAPSAMFLFPIAHVAAGLVLPYLALAFFLNSTFVEVGEGTLRVTHRPLPFPGKRTLGASDIRQLFCVERTGRKGSVTYDVMAQLASGRETKLVTGFSTDREARFIEQRIESRLGLANRPVSGELSA
jgi:hypothetical protein